MNARVWLATIAVLVSLPALAEDDDGCVLNPDALKPQVDATKLPKGWKLVKAGRVERVHSEVFALPDGSEVTVQISGCAHLGLTFTAKSKLLAKAKPGAALVVLKKLAAQTPFLKDAHLRPAIMKDAFDALKLVPEKFPVPLKCGEYETCELQQDAEGVSFAYDFPL